MVKQPNENDECVKNLVKAYEYYSKKSYSRLPWYKKLWYKITNQRGLIY